MVPFESLGTASYSHSTSTRPMAVSLVVLTQYTMASICLQHCEGPKCLLSPLLSSPLLPSPLLPFLFLASLPLPEVSPLIQLRGLGERCKLPQWGLGQSPSRQRFWCIFRCRNAAGGIQDVWFETSKSGLSLRFCEEVFQ